MNEPTRFDPGEYWDRRLKKHFDLRGVGYLRYSRRYNEHLYRAKSRAVAKVLEWHGIEVAGSSVLDLGCGMGFWLRWFRRAGATRIAGLDISTAAVARLRETLPWATVAVADLSGEWPLEGPFDIILAFDVLFHVVDDEGFERTLVQASRQLAPGGRLLLTDRIGESSEPKDRAGHVRFRDADRYESVLTSCGLEIEGIHPVFRLMNGGLANLPTVEAHPWLWWLVIRLENLLAPFLVLLDRLLATPDAASLRLLVARSSGEQARTT